MKRIKSIAILFLVLSLIVSPFFLINVRANEHVDIKNYDDFLDNFWFSTGADGSHWRGDTDSIVISAGDSGSCALHREEFIPTDGFYLNFTYMPVTNGTYTRCALFRIAEIGNRIYINSSGVVGYERTIGASIPLDTIEYDEWHRFSIVFNASTDRVGVNFDTFNTSKVYHWFDTFENFIDGDKWDDLVLGGAFGADNKYFLIEYKDFTYGDDPAGYAFELDIPEDNENYEYTKVFDLDNQNQTRGANPHGEHTNIYVSTQLNAWYNNDTGIDNGRIIHGRTTANISSVPPAYFSKYYMTFDPREAWEACNRSHNGAINFYCRIDGYQGSAKKLYNTSINIRWIEQNVTPSAIHADYLLLQQNYSMQSSLYANFSITSDIAEEFFNIANWTDQQKHFIWIWIGNNQTGSINPWHVAHPERTNYNGARWAVFDSYFSGPRPGETQVLDIIGYVQTDTPLHRATILKFNIITELLMSFIPIFIVIAVASILFRLFTGAKGHL